MGRAADEGVYRSHARKRTVRYLPMASRMSATKPTEDRL